MKIHTLFSWAVKEPGSELKFNFGIVQNFTRDLPIWGALIFFVVRELQIRFSKNSLELS